MVWQDDMTDAERAEYERLRAEAERLDADRAEVTAAMQRIHNAVKQRQWRRKKSQP